MFFNFLSSGGGAGRFTDFYYALQNVDLNGIVTSITDIIPVVLPVSLGILAIRKAWGFFMGQLRGA